MERAAAAAEQAFVAGLDHILLVTGLVAFAGATLSLALVRGRDFVAVAPEHAPVAA